MKIKHFSWPVLLLFFAHCATALADPPPTKFVPVPHKYVKTGLTVSFQTALVHNTGRTFIRMDASQTPGAAFDHGIYSWKPTLADVGTKRVTFTATRDGATIDTMEVPITVEPNRKRKGPLPGHKKTDDSDKNGGNGTNPGSTDTGDTGGTGSGGGTGGGTTDCPRFTHIMGPSVTLHEQMPYTYTVTAVKCDGSPADMEAAPQMTGCPDMKFEHGVLTWTPCEHDAGVYQVDFSILGDKRVTRTVTFNVEG